MTNPSDDIKARLNIVEVIGEYIRLQPAGSNFKAKCPFHQEKTPSLMVSPDKQIWHCFGCGRGGDSFAFVMEMEGLSFPEALRLLAPKAGIELKNYQGQDNSRRNRLLDLLGAATTFYHKQLLANNPLARSAYHYLTVERGLSPDIINEWQLGWAPNDWQTLSEAMKRLGYTDNEMLLAGLINQAPEGQRFYDRFRGRLMFPWHDVSGNIIGFSARLLPQLDDGQTGKYINSPQTMLYDKSRHLFGLWFAKGAIKEAQEVVIVEGQMDCLTAHQYNFKNVVATSGTALTEEHLKLLKRYTSNIVLAFDMDQAGLLAADRAIALGSQANLNIKVLHLPDGKDPDEFIRRHTSAWAEVVKQARPIMDYYYELLQPQLKSDKVEERKMATIRFLKMISQLSTVVERDYWLKELGKTLNLEVPFLYEELAKLEKSQKVSANNVPLRPAPQTKPVDLLLAWLIKFPNVLESLGEELEPEFLSDPRANQFYKNLIVYYNKNRQIDGQTINYPEFISWLKANAGELSNQLIAYIDSLFLLVDKDLAEATLEESLGEISRLAKVIKRAFWQQRLAIISHKIAELEKSRELSEQKRDLEINMLLGEAEDLSQKLRALDN